MIESDVAVHDTGKSLATAYNTSCGIVVVEYDYTGRVLRIIIER